jgi:rhomboid protease GluP
MNQSPSDQPIPQTPQPQTVQVASPYVKPYATYIILGVTVVCYLLQVGGQALLGQDLLFQLGAKYGPLIRAGQLWRLITPLFLHASILHIGFNMYALYIYGRGIEARFGHGRFLLLYFLSGFAGNVLSFLLTPGASIGASTAIFGLLTAEGVFAFQNRKLFGDRANRVLINIFIVAAVNLMIGFSTTGVDNYGHLGGLLGGLLFTWFGGPRWKLEGFYPTMKLVDEREGHGAMAGSFAVLLFFVPLAMLGWFWIVK